MAELVDVLKRLEQHHKDQLPELERLNSFYEGTQPLSYLHPELIAELDDRLKQVIVNWPELVVDSLDDRLDVEGFRVWGDSELEDELWEQWQRNDLDEASQMGHQEAMVCQRAYTIVGTNDGADEDEAPLITVESPFEVVHENDPRTRKVRDAAKFWCEGEGKDRVDHATLYVPGITVWWIRDGDGWIEDPENQRDEHGLDFNPVTPLLNKTRLHGDGIYGRSELASIIPISDAACKIGTDMMVSAEFHAMPRRWALGFGPEDFVDEHNNKISAWSKVAGRIWASMKRKDEGAEVGQFPEADLKNFHDTLNLLARMCGALGALPPHYMGFSDGNPASADAIRSSESRLVKRAERRQRGYGGSWETTQRKALAITGRDVSGLARMETVWRDPATPTKAQAADAAVKLFTAGISTKRQARIDVGYSDTQIKRMEEEDAEELERDPVTQLGQAMRMSPAQQAALAEAEAEDEAVLTGAVPAQGQ